MDILDVSPTRHNTQANDPSHSVTGRMLSIACTPDGQELYAGSYSNVWVSTDKGQTWTQRTWSQPDPSQFDVPGALGGWTVVDIAATLGWRVERHPRFLAGLTQSGFLDIVGFGECGMWTALGNGDGTFQNPNVVNSDFSPQPGGWDVNKHPRFMADLDGNGLADVVGFGYDGVWTAIGRGDGTFNTALFVVPDLGYNQGWRIDKHPRFVLDINGDGNADIVGFGDDGVWTAIGDGHGGFPQGANFVHPDFGFNQGWRVNLHPRFVADLDKDGLADIILFGADGVWTAFQNPDGTFTLNTPGPSIPDFGLDQGWHVDKHPRYVVDLDGDGYPDIIGFGDDGVWTAINDRNRGFQTPQFTPDLFGYNQGWRVDKHPRLIIDLNGDGIADLIGFGDAGIYTAIGKGDGTFEDAQFIEPANFGVDQGWRVDHHPRLAGDLGSGNIGIVGFGDAGVWTAVGDGQGGFAPSNFVLANFGYGTIVLALVANDVAALAVNGPFTGDRGLWRSTDWGVNWTQVHQFSTATNVGQLEWALGSDHLVYAAGGSSVAISKDAGATFQDSLPWGRFGRGSVNHIAVWQNSPADAFPAIIYALSDSEMYVSYDGGNHWIHDKATLPTGIGAATSQDAESNSAKVMVISPRCPLVVFVAQNGNTAATPAVLYRGDYTRFMGTQTSSWEPLILPDAIVSPTLQDSGNVFLAATQPDCGDLLFYGAQRLSDNSGCCSAAWVGPINPSKPSDWHRLDRGHADLHGFLLSPNFQGALNNGNYQQGSGWVWMLSDGGIYRSSNRGQSFSPADIGQTLASLSVAGVAIAGKGVALSLNQGDNDGFYSMNGGKNWSYQQYGGGDNDYAFADPLRPHAIMIFTPRWDTAGNNDPNLHGCQKLTVSVYQTQPGHLPDASATAQDRKAVTGPPIDPTCGVLTTPRAIWNASSDWAGLGFRPIVLGWLGETAPDEGDYIFVLGPNDPNPVLVRTQTIFKIKHRNEWITTATGPGQGANVFLQGPPLPEAGLGAVQASGGHDNTVFFAGGNGNLWTLAAGGANWQQIVDKSQGFQSATKFYAHPYQPGVIYSLDTTYRHVWRTDNGGGVWTEDLNLEVQLTWNHKIPLSLADVLTDMKFDPSFPRARFAVGAGGAFMTVDGVTWTRLLHTAALPGRPSTCYLDSFSEKAAALYVAFGGRSLVKIPGLSLTDIV